MTVLAPSARPGRGDRHPRMIVELAAEDWDLTKTDSSTSDRMFPPSPCIRGTREGRRKTEKLNYTR